MSRKQDSAIYISLALTVQDFTNLKDPDYFGPYNGEFAQTDSEQRTHFYPRHDLFDSSVQFQTCIFETPHGNVLFPGTKGLRRNTRIVANGERMEKPVQQNSSDESYGPTCNFNNT